MGTTPSVARDGPRSVEVELTDDFLVDDLREAILKKYPQSLGKYHDAADLSIRVPPRRHEGDGKVTDEIGRVLLPHEHVAQVMREEHPNGQKSSEAWTIITNGGRDSYTRWWLQTGGVAMDQLPLRHSPGQLMPNTGGSFSSDPAHQEYFPYIPHTAVTPPGEVPRSRTSGSMVSGGRTQQRPPLRSNRPTLEELYPTRRYEGSTTSSMVVETVGGVESEPSRVQGRGSPDTNLIPGARYQRGATGRNTPPGEYSNRARTLARGNISLPPTSILGQTQIGSQSQKPHSPLGGPPIHGQPRLSQGTGTRPNLQNLPSASTAVIPENPPPLAKGASSPNSPGSGNSSISGGNPAGSRRRSNTNQVGPVPGPTTPPGPEQPESPRQTRNPLVKPKGEKEPVPTKNSAIGNIPPINVLIVEDNIINAQILEVFFRKRKLKYATAVNGKEAVEKWRQGGWHLVLVYQLLDFTDDRWIYNYL
jgi:osomolarity two-component system, response regulator SSK1